MVHSLARGASTRRAGRGLASIRYMSDAGSKMPSFTLVDHEGVSVTSTGLAGSWYLLYWYPKADTPGCTAQAQGLRDQIESFDDLDCVVLGASFDTPEENAAFRNKYGLPFRLLTDPDHSVAVALGAADAADAANARRVAHLVDPTGVIQQRYEVDDPEFFAELVLDDLEAAQPE